MKNEIKFMEEKLLKAMKSNDVDAVDELLHDDLLFVIPTGQTVSKEIDMENMRSGRLKISDITSRDQIINVIEDNAIVSVVIHLQGSFGGQEFKEDFKYLRIWKKFASSWKVIGGSGMPINN